MDTKSGPGALKSEPLRICVLLMVAAIGIITVAPRMHAASQPSLHVRVGEKAPNFSLPSASGSMVSLSSLAGRNVLLDFYEGYW